MGACSGYASPKRRNGFMSYCLCYGMPRGHELTRTQKAKNRKLSRRRVRIEHVNSSVKRCRMLQETIRLWKAGIRDMTW
jgi:hypothetical protein